MQESHTTIDAGQHVRVRDEPWLVLSTEAFAATRVVHVRGLGDDNRDALRSFISPFDRIQSTAASTRLQQAARRRALATAAVAVADTLPWHECWTAASARIDLHAWQLEPAMAAVGGATRILIADHVGLGKTIQASLIVAELLARRLAHRVFVLTPPSLREQWAAEMSGRFALTPTIFDQASLSATVASLPAGVNPWQTAPIVISSIDLVKRPEVRAAIDRVSVDVLIVDEAHHVTPSTERGAVVADFAARTPWVVLVTATPHSGDQAAFSFLQRLGSAGNEPPLIFRRCRPPLAVRAGRRSRLLMLRPTPDEQRFLTAVSAYAHAVRSVSRGGTGSALVAAVIARRASSSARAAAQTIRRRAALLSRQAAPERQALLPWEDSEAADAEIDDTTLAMPCLFDVEQEVEWLERLAALAEQAAMHSSKAAVIQRLLSRTPEQALIFTEYRDVAAEIADLLRGEMPVTVLHGGLSPRERRAAVESFNSGRVRTLVGTDAAGEGLNLHYRCRLVINLELPWTPRRLEQRIGRVDRLGQKRRVHAIHLVHRGSFEGTVVVRLERRRAIAQADLADAAIVERATLQDSARELRSCTVRASNPQPRGAVYAARPCGARRDSRAWLIYTALVLGGGGRVVHKLVAPLAIELRPGIPHQHALSRHRLRALMQDGRVRETLRGRLLDQISDLPATLTAAAHRIDERIEACLDAVHRRRSTTWQGSLFDEAPEDDARVQSASADELCAHLVQMRESLSSLAAVRISEPRLIAAWLGD